MKIKGRQWLASGHDWTFPGYCLKEPLQFGLAFNDDSGAPLPHHGQVADELNGIAQSLLGVEQKGTIFQWAAVPLPLSEVPPWGREILAFPSPFQFFPALLKIPPR